MGGDKNWDNYYNMTGYEIFHIAEIRTFIGNNICPIEIDRLSGRGSSGFERQISDIQ